MAEIGGGQGEEKRGGMKQAAACIAVTHKSHGSQSLGDHQCQHDTMC